MTKSLLKIIPILAFSIASQSPAQSNDIASEIALIPSPTKIEKREGLLNLSRNTRIVCTHAELEPLAKVLAEEMQLLTRFTPAVGKIPAKAGDIVLQIDAAIEGESYKLDVTEHIIIKGGNYNAISSGTSTLLQLIRTGPGTISLPKVSIEDSPDFSFRSAMIDLGRKYHSIGGIEQVIRMCRFYKIRYLHLHLSDDQLFMFPSKKFSKAGQSNSEFQRFEPPAMPKIEPYKLKELIDLNQYARERGVLLIPELDLPGHSGRLIADEPEHFALPGNGSTVHIASPKTLEAVETLLNEIMDVFDASPYVHLGADEVSLHGLEETPEYKAALEKDPTLKNPHDVYHKFINHMNDIVQKRGRTSLVWEEAWTTQGPYPLPKDVVVIVWNQGRNPVNIANEGYKIINTTWTPLYIVRDNKKTPEFLFNWKANLFGREGSEEFTTLEDQSNLLGIQLTSWENSEAIEIQSMRARLPIVAERSWNAESGGSFDDFRKIWQHTDAKLDLLVHPIEMKVDGRILEDEITFTDPITVELIARKSDVKIRYTLDNSMPGASWKDYKEPLVIDKEVHLRAGLFDRQGKQSGHLLGAWFRPQKSE